MLRSLKIERFRRFERFELYGLGRVNLLVGLNNSGKTSVLEAVHLLTTRDLPAIHAAALRRGERLFENGGRDADVEIDVCRLFHGFGLSPGSSFRIDGENQDQKESVEVEVIESETINSKGERHDVVSLSLDWNGVRDLHPFTISPRSGVSWTPTVRFPRGPHGEPVRPVKFIDLSSLTAREVVSLFGEVVLTPDEATVLEALKIIDPTIERIAPISQEWAAPVSGHWGFHVRCTGYDQRIPIGTLGDGVWRMLGLALALVKSEGGVLLVDEIDAGLHYTAMSDMWRLIYETAVKTDIQVFATTHNSDCWTSLATIIRDREDSTDISIQRIEPDRGRAVAFSHEEIVIAAERDIEVR
ncbi:MAG TPA: ATP-binding protein [Thermoanaerobaculia bacterium]|jgi:hypothetical protein